MNNNAIVTFKEIGGLCPAILGDVQFSMYCTWNSVRAFLLGAKKKNKGEWEYTNKNGVTFTIRSEKDMDSATREYYNDPQCSFVSLFDLAFYNPEWAK